MFRVGFLVFLTKRPRNGRSGIVRGFSRFVLSLFLGLLTDKLSSTYGEQSRKRPRHNPDLSRKKWETPRLGNSPRFSFSFQVGVCMCVCVALRFFAYMDKLASGPHKVCIVTGQCRQMKETSAVRLMGTESIRSGDLGRGWAQKASILRVQRFIEWPKPLYWIAFPDFYFVASLSLKLHFNQWDRQSKTADFRSSTFAAKFVTVHFLFVGRNFLSPRFCRADLGLNFVFWHGEF